LEYLEYIVFGQAQQNANYTNKYNEIIFYHFREGGNSLFMQHCCVRGIPAFAGMTVKGLVGARLCRLAQPRMTVLFTPRPEGCCFARLSCSVGLRQKSPLGDLGVGI
jgi:hypothetical protein